MVNTESYKKLQKAAEGHQRLPIDAEGYQKPG